MCPSGAANSQLIIVQSHSIEMELRAHRQQGYLSDIPAGSPSESLLIHGVQKPDSAPLDVMSVRVA